MNIFKQLDKLPKTDINEVNYGNKKHLNDNFHVKRSKRHKIIEGKTYQEWADHYGIDYNYMRDRILREGTPHPKGTTHLYSKITTYQGKPANWWGKKLGVTGECIRYRMIKYGTPFKPTQNTLDRSDK